MHARMRMCTHASSRHVARSTACSMIPPCHAALARGLRSIARGASAGTPCALSHGCWPTTVHSTLAVGLVGGWRETTHSPTQRGAQRACARCHSILAPHLKLRGGALLQAARQRLRGSGGDAARGDAQVAQRGKLARFQARGQRLRSFVSQLAAEEADLCKARQGCQGLHSARANLHKGQRSCRTFKPRPPRRRAGTMLLGCRP